MFSLMPSIRRRTSHALTLLAVLFALSACAGLASRTPEEAVRERAQARWNALLAGKFDEAYRFLSPGSRALISPGQFRGSIGGAAAWKTAEVHAVTCPQPDRCIASIKVSYQPVLPRLNLSTIERSVEETWLLDAGQWWLPQRL